MHIEHLTLIGGGGHAKVVLDALRCGPTASVRITVRDDDPALAGVSLSGYAIEVPALPGRLDGFHVAIGNNRIRDRLSVICGSSGGRPIDIAHPHAIVAADATVGAGCFIAAAAIIAPDAVLEEGVIVNHGAVVDHDCRVGRFAHIAPNATLGGGVVIGDRVLIGSGAIVLPGVEIGDDVTIGAGAVVHRNVPAGETMIGVPARNIGCR